MTKTLVLWSAAERESVKVNAQASLQLECLLRGNAAQMLNNCVSEGFGPPTLHDSLDMWMRGSHSKSIEMQKSQYGLVVENSGICMVEGFWSALRPPPHPR